MSLPDYRKMPPRKAERAADYCHRLELAGHDELFLRKALTHHFQMPLEDMKRLLDRFPTARLRHISVLRKLHPNGTTLSMTSKLARNLGMTAEEAGKWVQAHEEAAGFDLQSPIIPTHSKPAKLQ